MGQIHKSRIIEQLTRELSAYPKSLRRIAMYVIDNPAEFGMDSIRDSAALIGVSTNSLVRLAKKLGFKTYHQFRAPFREALTASASSGDSGQWIGELYERGGKERARADAATSVMGNVTDALRQTDADSIALAADCILEAKKVFLVATRGPYALVHYFYHVGRIALPNLVIAPRHANAPVDEILTADENDVVLAISSMPYSRETIDACEMAKKKGAKLILMSDSAANSLPLTPYITLVSPVSTPHYFESYVGFFALLEWLLTVLVERGGDDIQKRIQMFNDLRNEANLYWKI